MPKEVTLDWTKSTTIENESFPQDTLGRVKYAQFLTKFLADQGYDSSRDDGEGKRNYVLNLNSEWGSGKTYFLKRWSEDLKGSFPTVYIDAWKQDYSDDPLMTVISSVISQLREQADLEENDTTLKVSNKVLGLLKAAAPGFARSVAKRYFDIDPVAIMRSEEGESIETKGSDGEPVIGSDGKPIDMSLIASDMVKHLINEHDAKSNAIKGLKENIEQWIETVIAHKKLQFPAFIFIDELDRCRPSYAVEMLETIKHIFDIKGIVFVVATDTEQLQHAVKAIYGEDFNAQLYLGRFFNSRFSLKAPDLKDFLEVHVDSHKLSGDFLEKRGIKILPPNPDGKVTLRNIAVILDAFNMPPRTAIQIADRVIATLSNMQEGSKIDLLMLTILLCFKEENDQRFKDIVSNQLHYKDRQGDTAGLERYIHERFSESASSISMHFNPKDIYTTLRVEEYMTFNHDYSENNYSFNLFRYFEAIFFCIFCSQSFPASTSIQIDLQQTDSHSERFKSGILWLQAMYIENGFSKILAETYQDYVELASALDWIDGNSDDA